MFANSGGLVLYLRLRSLKTRGVDGEAVSTLEEWIREGHRVYYRTRLPEGRPPVTFVEVGVATWKSDKS